MNLLDTLFGKLKTHLPTPTGERLAAPSDATGSMPRSTKPKADTGKQQHGTGQAGSPRHQIRLLRQDQEHVVDYALRRSPRARRIGFRIDHSGLSVTIPQRARISQASIESALHEHADWIIDKMAKWQQRAVHQDNARPRYTDGGQIPLLGESITLRLQPHSAHKRTRVLQVGNELWVSGPAAHDPALLPAAITGWLKHFARRTFIERTPPFADRLGRQPRSIGLSSARTRWGSCTGNGDIRLNWRLIQFEPILIDYVIAHELAHLVELNHSQRFWAQLEQLMPDYKVHKTALAAKVDAYLPA